MLRVNRPMRISDRYLVFLCNLSGNVSNGKGDFRVSYEWKDEEIVPNVNLFHSWYSMFD